MCWTAPSSHWQSLTGKYDDTGHKSKSQYTVPTVMRFCLNYPLQWAIKNTRPSGEREISHTTVIFTIIFMLIASKYAMNVLVSSMQTVPDIKCLSDITGAHHVSSSILQTQRASFQKTMKRFRDQGKTDSHCQVYKILQSLCLKGRPTAFTMSSGTPTTLAYFPWHLVKSAFFK